MCLRCNTSNVLHIYRIGIVEWYKRNLCQAQLFYISYIEKGNKLNR